MNAEVRNWLQQQYDSRVNKKKHRMYAKCIEIMDEQAEENAQLDQNVCDECRDKDGAPTGWVFNRVEGKAPCTCMLEAEPYQALLAQNERLGGWIRLFNDLQGHSCAGCNGDECGSLSAVQYLFEDLPKLAKETPAQSLSALTEAARREERERCAKVCDRIKVKSTNRVYEAHNASVDECAEAIRELDKEQGCQE